MFKSPSAPMRIPPRSSTSSSSSSSQQQQRMSSNGTDEPNMAGFLRPTTSSSLPDQSVDHPESVLDRRLPRYNSMGDLQAISERCSSVERVMDQLMRDRQQLEQSLQVHEYQDAHIEEHMMVIKQSLQNCLNGIAGISEDSGRPVWERLARQAETAIIEYQNKLVASTGRVAYVETQKCLQQLNALLDKMAQSLQARPPSGPLGSGPSGPLGSANSSDEQEITCCICLDRKVDCSAHCGHLMCSECVQSVEQCPICRAPVEAADIRRVYL